MKNLKKFFIGFMTLAFVASADVNSSSADTSTYLKGDVNNNNQLDIADLSSIALYLSGSTTVDNSTAERMDVDGNKVVDSSDKAMISSMLLGDTPKEYETYSNDSDIPNTLSRTYYRYNPVSGVKKGSYTLPSLNTLTTTSVNSNIEERGIIGEDDRVAEPGLQGVLNVQLPSGENFGTAFVVDDHTILTAAHVLYNYDTDTSDGDDSNLRQNLKFKVFDSNNTATNIQITPVEYHIPARYVNNGSDRYDYAIVTTSEDLSNYNGVNYINFDLGTMRCARTIGDSTNNIYVTGFGGSGSQLDEEINSDLENIKSTGCGSLKTDDVNSSDDDYFLRYYTDMVGGDSGGPVYIYSGSTKVVIGINVYSILLMENGQPTANLWNEGIKITPDILSFVYNNSNLSIIE